MSLSDDCQQKKKNYEIHFFFLIIYFGVSLILYKLHVLIETQRIS